DPLELRLRSVDLHAFHEARERRLPRDEEKPPCALVALEPQGVRTLEGFAIAGERAANAFDEERDLRMLGEREDLRASAAFDHQTLAIGDHALVPGARHAPFEAIGRREDELSRGLEGPVEDRDVLRLVEARAPGWMRLEKLHERAHVPGGVRGGAGEEEERPERRAHRGAARPRAARHFQKWWKLKKLSGARRL